MNVFNIMIFLGELGAKFNRNHLLWAEQYLQNMAMDNRIILVSHRAIPHTFVAFSICNSYERFVNKGVWEYKKHYPKGSVCFIEKLASKNWNRDVRKRVEEEIVSYYANVDTGVWYRPGTKNDRRVIYHRRIHEISL